MANLNLKPLGKGVTPSTETSPEPEIVTSTLLPEDVVIEEAPTLTPPLPVDSGALQLPSTGGVFTVKADGTVEPLK